MGVIFNLNFKKILKSLEIVLNIEMILKKIKSLKNYENLESLEILVLKVLKKSSTILKSLEIVLIFIFLEIYLICHF